MSNKIKHFRTKLNLTQAELAAAVGTSQQQIQRFEADVQTPRIDLATKLAEALKVSMRRLFPVSREPGRESPIDPDPALNTIVVTLKSGLEERFVISSMDKDRLKSCLRRFDPEEWSAERQFFCFNSGSDTIVVNLASVVHVRFYFDAPFPSLEAEAANDEDDGFNITFYLNGSPEPFQVEVEPDRLTLAAFHETEGAELREGDAQIQAFLFEMDSGPDAFIEFLDSDGEEIVLNTGSIDLVRVPLIVSNPALYDDWAGEHGEDSAEAEA